MPAPAGDGIQVAIDLGTPEREQAENVGLHMGYGSFPDWTEEDVAEFRVSPGERVHMAFVSNESRRPTLCRDLLGLSIH